MSLGGILRAAADGEFPPVDGKIEVVPPYRTGLEAVVAFTGHAVFATTLDVEVIRGLGADGYGGAYAPSVMAALGGAGARLDCLDAMLVARGTGGGGLAVRADLDDHPRVRLARSLRDDVAVYGSGAGFVTLGRGVGGLPELSVEVSAPGRGFGRRLIRSALGLVPAGEVVVACVAPGNAISTRAFLATGFTPIGSVQLVHPGVRM
ncbi:hypothetical protein [Fodinicola acaciae]|uniref:hypothetical protein n=1 Tax=Fodinicola acaciae TaxID=2681555 RepID=UPI0013D19B4E|nr:hypothetical protein [Fodinicola acaciae]